MSGRRASSRSPSSGDRSRETGRAPVALSSAAPAVCAVALATATFFFFFFSGALGTGTGESSFLGDEEWPQRHPERRGEVHIVLKETHTRARTGSRK